MKITRHYDPPRPPMEESTHVENIVEYHPGPNWYFIIGLALVSLSGIFVIIGSYFLIRWVVG